MTPELQLILLAGAVIYLLLIFRLLKIGKLSIKFSLLWLASGAVLVLFAVCPYVVYVLRDILEIQMPSNLVFLLLFCFVLLVLLILSVAVSDYADRLKRLTQENAMLEKRVRELEHRLDGRGC